MPRPRDKREVSYRVTPAQPRWNSVIYTVDFASSIDLGASNLARKVDMTGILEESRHLARIVDGATFGTIFWKRIVRARGELPGITVREEIVDPPALTLLSGFPADPPDRNARWPTEDDSYCEIRLWVRPNAGVEARISAAPPYEITLKKGSEMRTFTLSATVSRIVIVSLDPKVRATRGLLPAVKNPKTPTKPKKPGR